MITYILAIGGSVQHEVHTLTFSPEREREAVEGMVMAKKKHRLTVEDYLDFIDDRTLPLTAPLLRQSMLTEIVTTMDLMDLRRSTLLDGWVSGDVCTTLEEVTKDLKVLDWQECPVTSLLIQGAMVSASSAASSEGTVSVKRRRTKERQTKPIHVEIDDSVVSTGTIVPAGSTTSTGSLRSVDCNSPQPQKFKSVEAAATAALN